MNDSPRLLLVDDDALNREVALDQLKELGLSADIAGNGAIAVAMAQQTRYHLILMDIQMPVMDGREACRRILALAEHGQTPIVALTANVLPENRLACRNAGMVDYLEKPLALERLRNCLARWLPTTQAEAGLPAVDQAGQSLIDALEQAGGFAPRTALGTLGIKTEKYPLLLNKYIDVHGDSVARTGAALRAGDLQLARRLAHTLKGTAATLGVMATSEAAAHLDRMLAAATDAGAVDTLYRELEETDRQQMATLRRLLISPTG